MSRAVVESSIINDSRMQALGFTQDYVLVNYDGEQRPTITLDTNMFMFLVIRFGPQDIDPRMFRGPWHFDIWVHMAQEFSSDFNRIDSVIEILDDVLTSIVDTPGADGRSVTCIDLEGRSRDLSDPVYQTFCRNTSYKMISRMTATGKV